MFVLPVQLGMSFAATGSTAITVMHATYVVEQTGMIIGSFGTIALGLFFWDLSNPKDDSRPAQNSDLPFFMRRPEPLSEKAKSPIDILLKHVKEKTTLSAQEIERLYNNIVESEHYRERFRQYLNMNEKQFAQFDVDAKLYFTEMKDSKSHEEFLNILGHFYSFIQNEQIHKNCRFDKNEVQIHVYNI